MFFIGVSPFQIAGESSTVDDGIRILKSTRVDIVLLDINLGLQQGGAFPKLAREEGFSGKILVVTAGVSKLEASRLLQRGWPSPPTFSSAWRGTSR